MFHHLRPRSSRGPVSLTREDCYQVLEALTHAADLAAAVRAYAVQVDAEDAFAIVRDRLLPHALLGAE